MSFWQSDVSYLSFSRSIRPRDRNFLLPYRWSQKCQGAISVKAFFVFFVCGIRFVRDRFPYLHGGKVHLCISLRLQQQQQQQVLLLLQNPKMELDGSRASPLLWFMQFLCRKKAAREQSYNCFWRFVYLFLSRIRDRKVFSKLWAVRLLKPTNLYPSYRKIRIGAIKVILFLGQALIMC